MKAMKVQMFGKFSVYYGDQVIVFRKAASAKTVRLLQMLLLVGENGISKTELIDGLYGWNENSSVISRNKNLNKLIYRLRENLVSNGFPEEDYVVISDGMCYWKSSFPVLLDTSEFEKKIRDAIKSEGKEKKNLLQSACSLYSGELLPMNHSDIWFFEKSNYYKQIYSLAVRELIEIYHSGGDYRQLIDLYNRIIMIYPFDDWQTGLIRCYLEQDQHDKALQVYNDTMDLYAKEMGIPPTEEMQKCFEWMNLQTGSHHKRVKNYSEWKNMETNFLGERNLIQAIYNDKDEKGACYCTYPSFVDFCRLVMRAQERHHLNGVMMFLTFTQSEKKGTADEEDRKVQMEILREAVGMSLRRGDAYTRYGNRHYILMLTNIEVKHCPDVFRRIETRFRQMSSSKSELWYQIVGTGEI